MRVAIVAAVALLALPVLAGCIGGEGHSEWAYDVTQLDAARDDGYTGAGIRVGVVDTGIDVTHPSMDHLVDGDDSNGELKGFRDYLRDRFGVDHAHDASGHGTHVTGIISARGSSFQDRLLYGGIDLRGGSQDVLLYVAKVCDEETCSSSALTESLRWMRQQDLDVVSLSLGGQRNPLAINDANRNEINAMIDAGTVVIASAGNSGPCGEETTSDVDAPADIRGVIAVGAIDDDLEVSCISSRGNNGGTNACRTSVFGQQLGRCDPNKKPELVAPGVDILSAWKDGQYVRATGTSQAAPFVTSAVALMLEARGVSLDSREQVMQVKQVLADTARDLQGQSTPHDPAAGYGLVQATAAIDAYAAA